MTRSAGSPKRPWHIAAAAGALAVLAVLVVATVSSAASARGTAPASLSTAAAHKCLVMTGSGDPAFVRNFNPYTATGLPSGQFIKGAMYEGLIVVPAGGLKPVPWLARTWKWTNGNKTLTLNLAKNVKWSDGTALTSADVVYSLKGGTGAQSKVMDIIGYTRPDTNIRRSRRAASTPL